MGQGLNGTGRVRAAKHSRGRHTPSVKLGQGLWARTGKHLPSEGKYEGPG